MRKVVALILASVCAVSLASCSSGGQAEGSGAEARTISHDLGETRITGDPKRIVALEFSFVETLLMLGTTPVGIADDQDPKRVAQLAEKQLEYTSVGTRSEPNQEVIASLKPDLIIADTDRHSKVYAQLSKIAPTIVLNSREGDYETMKKGTVTIADALGDRESGTKAVADHEKRMAEIAASIPASETRSIQLATARDKLLRIHTSGSFVGGVLTALGRTVPVQSTEAYEDASLERIASVNPDVLLLSSDSATPVTDTWTSNPVWLGMTAVKNKTVFEADRNLYTRFRGLNTAERIAKDVAAKLASTS